MWLLQNRPQREPLPGPVKRVSTLRIGIALPGHRLNIRRQLRRPSIQGQEIAGNDFAAPAAILRGKHVSLFPDRIAAKYALFTGLIFGAVKIIVRSDVADEREVFRAPETFVEQNLVLNDAGVLKFISCCA